MIINVFIGVNKDAENLFPKPVFITTFEQSLYSVLLLPSLIKIIQGRPFGNLKKTIKIALILGFPLYVANILNQESYSLTSMSSSVIINQSTIIFVFILSLLFLGTKFSWNKLLCVLICVLGVCIISLEDQGQEETGSWAGNLLAFTDSIFYAIYGCLIFLATPKEKSEEVSYIAILGFIGLLWAILGPVVVLTAHVTGIEEFEKPPLEAIGFMALDASVTMMYEYTLARATAYLGPLTSNVTLASIIPLTIIIDYFWSAKSYSLFYLFASVAIIQAVICMNLEENRD